MTKRIGLPLAAQPGLILAFAVRIWTLGCSKQGFCNFSVSGTRSDPFQGRYLLKTGPKELKSEHRFFVFNANSGCAFTGEAVSGNGTGAKMMLNEKMA